MAGISGLPKIVNPKTKTKQKKPHLLVPVLPLMQRCVDIVPENSGR